MQATASDDRLAKLKLLPPPTMQPWTSLAPTSPEIELTRTGQAPITLPLSLFWYAPDWYQHSTELTNPIAAAVGRLGITVAALRSEVSQQATPSSLHEEDLPRMVPYRPERYGLAAEDFDQAKVIDVRLTMVPDPGGRFAFPPQQITRWESRTGKSAGASGGWVAAATFPPDVDGIDALSGKVNQLRTLAPESAILASIQPFDLENDLATLIRSGFDGAILRADRLDLEALTLARLVSKARRLLDSGDTPAMPLWVVPGPINADDAAKLVALGATGVAVDSWCHDLFALNLAKPTSAAERLGLADPAAADSSDYLAEAVASHLRDRVDRFVGLTTNPLPKATPNRLGTFDADWANELGLPLLG